MRHNDQDGFGFLHIARRSAECLQLYPGSSPSALLRCIKNSLILQAVFESRLDRLSGNNCGHKVTDRVHEGMLVANGVNPAATTCS